MSEPGIQMRSIRIIVSLEYIFGENPRMGAEMPELARVYNTAGRFLAAVADACHKVHRVRTYIDVRLDDGSSGSRLKFGGELEDRFDDVVGLARSVRAVVEKVRDYGDWRDEPYTVPDVPHNGFLGPYVPPVDPKQRAIDRLLEEARLHLEPSARMRSPRQRKRICEDVAAFLSEGHESIDLFSLTRFEWGSNIDMDDVRAALDADSRFVRHSRSSFALKEWYEPEAACLAEAARLALREAGHPLEFEELKREAKRRFPYSRLWLEHVLDEDQEFVSLGNWSNKRSPRMRQYVGLRAWGENNHAYLLSDKYRVDLLFEHEVSGRIAWQFGDLCDRLGITRDGVAAATLEATLTDHRRFRQYMEDEMPREERLWIRPRRSGRPLHYSWGFEGSV